MRARIEWGITLALTASLLVSGCSFAYPWRSAFTRSTDDVKAAKDDALTKAEEAKAEKRRSAEQLEAAQECVARGENDESRRILKTLLKRDPGCRDASLMLAVLYADNHNVKSAIHVLEDALEQAPNDAELHHSLGTMLEIEHRLPEAKGHFAQASKLAPFNRVFRQSLNDLHGVTAVESDQDNQRKAAQKSSQVAQKPVKPSLID